MDTGPEKEPQKSGRAEARDKGTRCFAKVNFRRFVWTPTTSRIGRSEPLLVHWTRYSYLSPEAAGLTDSVFLNLNDSLGPEQNFANLNDPVYGIKISKLNLILQKTRIFLLVMVALILLNYV